MQFGRTVVQRVASVLYHFCVNTSQFGSVVGIHTGLRIQLVWHVHTQQLWKNCGATRATNFVQDARRTRRPYVIHMMYSMMLNHAWLLGSSGTVMPSRWYSVRTKDVTGRSMNVRKW